MSDALNFVRPPCATYGGSDWFLMCHLYTVVFASRNDYNSNRSDTDVSLSDALCFNSPEHDVRYSSILMLTVRSLFSKLS
jgi:hypothetical protein